MGNVISRATLFAGALVGGLGIFFIMMAANALWIIPKAKEAGRESERTAALARSMEIIKERSRTNAHVNALTDSQLCIELGGVFEDGECR